MVRLVSDVSAKLFNKTCWSCTHEILKQYCKLRALLPNSDCAEVHNMLPDPERDDSIDSFKERFDNMNLITTILQDDETSLKQANILFARATDRWPLMKDRLCSDASIVGNSYFEFSIARVQEKKEHTLQKVVRKAIKHLLLDQTSAFLVLKPRKTDFEKQILEDVQAENVKNSKQMSTYSFVSTSNICERLFSSAGYALNDRRKGLLPTRLEMHLFLYVNARFWDVVDVYEAIQQCHFLCHKQI